MMSQLRDLRLRGPKVLEMAVNMLETPKDISCAILEADTISVLGGFVLT